MVPGLDTSGMIPSPQPPVTLSPLQKSFIQCQQKTRELYTNAHWFLDYSKRILRMDLEPDNGLLFRMDGLITQKVSQISKKHSGTWQVPENSSPLPPTHRNPPCTGFPNLRPWPCQCQPHSAVRLLLFLIHPSAWHEVSTYLLLSDQQTALFM